MANEDQDRWAPDPSDVARRKKELLAEARGEATSGPPGGQLGMGLQFVVAVLVCLFAGQWLDKKMGTQPWLMIAGVMVGGGLGFWSLLRTAQSAERSGRPPRNGA